MAVYKECDNCGSCFPADRGVCENCGLELTEVQSPYAELYLNNWFSDGRTRPPTEPETKPQTTYKYCTTCGKWVKPEEDGSCPNCAKPECSYKGPKLPPNEQIGNSLDDLMEAVPSLNIEWNFTNNHVDILGTLYSFEKHKVDEDPQLGEKLDGYCDLYAKQIVVGTGYDKPETRTKNLPAYEDHVARHEIVHAFLHESGLSGEGEREWLVDWIAHHLPKLAKACKDVNVL